MSSFLRVLRHRDFKYLFLGQSASTVGDQVVVVALALYITQRTGSATDLGLVLAAQVLPMVVLLLFGGVWADRLARHRIMIATDLIRAVLHGTLALLIVTGGASVGEMVVIEALFGAARAFFQPAYTGLLPQTIAPELAQDARAVSETTANLAFLVGPALGTGLVLGVGAGAAFAFDAGTFVISALLLGRVSPGAAGAAGGELENPAGGGSSVWQELSTGWREVSSRPWVWMTISAFSVAILCAYAPWYALAPSIARAHYGGAAVFGLLESVGGGGAVAGALVGIAWRPRRPLVAGLLLVLFWPLQDIAFALGAPLLGVVALAAATGFGFSLFIVWWETALARNIPPHALSRVSSYDWMGALALMPLGFVLSGPLATTVGARTVLGVGGVIGLAMLLAALIPRSTRSLAGEDPRRDAVAAPAVSAQELASDVGVEPRREAEVADVDPLVGVVHQRRRLE